MDKIIKEMESMLIQSQPHWDVFCNLTSVLREIVGCHRTTVKFLPVVKREKR